MLNMVLDVLNKLQVCSATSLKHRWQKSILDISCKEKTINVELDKKPWTTYWEKDNLAGLDTWCEWITSAYHSKRCTGRYQDTGEDQVDHERTGGAQSTKTCRGWGSAGRKQRWQLLTDTDGVAVWPNVSTGTQDESRSRSRTRSRFQHTHNARKQPLNSLE